MRTLWWIVMGARVNGVILLAIVVAFVLLILVSKFDSCLLYTIAVLVPIITAVVVSVRMLITQWNETNFERPVLTGIVYGLLFFIIKGINDWIFWGLILGKFSGVEDSEEKKEDTEE